MKRIKVAICQPQVPHYRVPIFNLLGREQFLDLWIFAGNGERFFSAAKKARYFRLIRDNIWHISLRNMDLYYQPSQVKIINKEQFDLVILPWNIRYLSLFPALVRARTIDLPIVLWGHGYSKRERSSIRYIRNYAGKKATAVLLYSTSVAKRLIRKDGFSPECVYVAQNALEQKEIEEAKSFWSKNIRMLERFQQEYDLNPDQTIIFVSRLERENKVDMLITGFRQIANILPFAKLVLVGDGSDRTRLEHLARRLNLNERVIFTGAIYAEFDLAPWMLSSALFCYPVNIGLSLLHAFGYGLPVVTSDDILSHNPEIEAFIPGENGLAYRDGDIRDMVFKCLTILQNKDLRERFSEKAVKQVTENYTSAKMVQGFKEVICGVCKKRGLGIS